MRGNTSGLSLASSPHADAAKPQRWGDFKAWAIDPLRVKLRRLRYAARAVFMTNLLVIGVWSVWFTVSFLYRFSGWLFDNLFSRPW